jgi:hypothetical protein
MKSVIPSGYIGDKRYFIDVDKYWSEIESQAIFSFAKYGIAVPETESVQASGDEFVSIYLKNNNMQTLPMVLLYPTGITDVRSNLGGSGSYFFTAVLVSKSKQVLWLADLNVRTGGGFNPITHTSFLLNEIAKRLSEDGFY